MEQSKLLIIPENQYYLELVCHESMKALLVTNALRLLIAASGHDVNLANILSHNPYTV